MRNWAIILAMVVASAVSAAASKEETLAEMIARADAARPEERPALYTEIAERQLKAADRLYGDGKAEEARAAVNDVVTYCNQATNAAISSGKKLKQTEIAVRKMAARLRDIRRGLAFEDQAPVQAAVEKLENLRTTLLNRMFGDKNKK
jgi:polyhydroxyalkanoate synthesis regulator phasin